MWGEPCLGLDCGEEVAAWLTRAILGTETAELRLVWHRDGDTSRPVKEDRSASHSIPGSNLRLVFYTLIVLVNIDYCMKTMQCNTNKNLLTLAWLTIGYRQ